MKKILIVIFLIVSLGISAQSKFTIRDAFKVMPDSLIPYLSVNNRLDMIDFLDAKMKAEVTNLLDGKSEMLVLNDDSLSIRLNPVVLLNMWFEPVDTGKIICLWKVYNLREKQSLTVEELFTTDWKPLSKRKIDSTLLRRDEEIEKKRLTR